MRRVRLFIAACAVAFGLSGLAPALALAATPPTPTQTVCTTLNPDDHTGTCDSTPPGSIDINHVLKALINILSLLVGIVAVVMIIFSGFRYVTAGGDSGRISGAKNTLIYSIIGLIVAALAQTIVKFVLQKVK